MALLGIDLGTSSVKVLAVEADGTIIGEASKSYMVNYPKENWAEQNPEDWWKGTKEAIKTLIQNYPILKNTIHAISFSGQMHGLVILDENNQVLRPAILWCDQRTEKECESITAFFGQEKLTQYIGNKMLPGFTAPKILWVKQYEPSIYMKIRHILLPKDYIRFRLTGDYATDFSDASGMALLDVKNKKWSKELLKHLEIDETVLPKLYHSYEITGRISNDIMTELGLEGDIPVIAGASDQAAGAIGTGTVEEGMVSVTLGTSGVVFSAHNQYAVDAKNRLHAFCHANGKYHSMGVMLSAASCLKWWVEDIHPDLAFEEILEEAENTESKPKLIFLPYLMGERTPYSDPDAKGCFIGLTMNTTRGEMTRAVLEGVAYGLRDSLEILRDIHIPIREIRVIGGGSKSKLWIHILANVFNTPIQMINTNQGGALGAALLAGVGIGVYSSVDSACKSVIQVINSIEPNLECSNEYDKGYRLYQRLYRELENYFKFSARQKL